MLSFAFLWAFLLLPLPWLIRPRNTAEAAIPILPFQHRLAELPGVQRHTGQRAPWEWLLLGLAWLALVLTLARPQMLDDQISPPVSGRDLMLAVDISPSMDVEDMIVGKRAANRLVAVKHVVDQFLDQRTGDRIGLILFGTQAYLHVPLSFDLTTVRALLQEAELGMAGDATAIGDAIGLAIKRLRERPAEQRVLVLLTDGANNAGDVPPREAARLAAQSGVRIYTLGIGAEEMLQQSLFGTRRVNPSTDLDEPLLRAIAGETGGQYFRARSLPELELAYATIDRLERIERDAQPLRRARELYAWPLGVGAGCLALLLLMRRFVAPREAA